MRRATAWSVVVGVLATVGFATPARADTGFWVSVAAGMAGAQSPSDYTEFWFDSPHGPAISLNQLTGAGTVQATTGGGNTFFTGDATPVLLPTTDGFATLTNPGVANGSGGLPRFTGGTQASAPPGAAAPTGGENLLGVDIGPKAEDGSQVVGVGVTDPNGNPLGNGQVTLPDGGWFVIGLGPGGNDSAPPPPPDPIGGDDDDDDEPGDGGVPPVVVPAPPDLSSPGVATPEPATFLLVGLGGLTAATWRRLRRR